MQNCLGRFSKSSTFTSERNCPSRCQFGGSFNYGGTLKCFIFSAELFNWNRFISIWLYQSDRKHFIFFSAYYSTWLLHIEVVHELVDAVFPVKDVDPGDGDVQHLRHQLVALLLVMIRAAVAPPAVSLWFLTRTNLGLTFLLYSYQTKSQKQIHTGLEWFHSGISFHILIIFAHEIFRFFRDQDQFFALLSSIPWSLTVHQPLVARSGL